MLKYFLKDQYALWCLSVDQGNLETVFACLFVTNSRGIFLVIYLQRMKAHSLIVNIFRVHL